MTEESETATADARRDAVVLIVGAGPAGSTAARVLGDAGVRTLIVDRATFPRRKPCGGGIPHGTRRLFDFDLPAPSHTTTYNRRFFNFERESRSQSMNRIEMVDRREFDAQLLREACERPSVEFRGGINIRSVEMNSDGVTVQTVDGDRLRAAFVIGADGANSIVARSLDLVDDDRPAVALDIEIVVPDEVYEQHCEFATFHFGCVDAGYAWVFPKRNVLSCGIGSWTGATGLQAKLDAFLERVFPGVEYEVVYRAGQALPLYSATRKTSSGRALLVGDAAGMVDPVFGEGIRYAMLSGRQAAECIIEGIAANDPFAVGAFYEAATRERWGERFRAQRALAFRDLIEAPEFFYRTFIEGGVHYDQWYDAVFAEKAKQKP